MSCIFTTKLEVAIVVVVFLQVLGGMAATTVPTEFPYQDLDNTHANVENIGQANRGKNVIIMTRFMHVISSKYFWWQLNFAVGVSNSQILQFYLVVVKVDCQTAKLVFNSTPNFLNRYIYNYALG